MRRLALAAALSLAACRPRAAPPAPSAPAPDVAPQPAARATSGDAGVTFATAEAALRALTYADNARLSDLMVQSTLDLDGDGRPDTLYGAVAGVRSGCVLVRQGPVGWRADALSTGVAYDNAECLAPIRLGTRALVVATASGRDRGTPGGGAAPRWKGYTIFGARPGEAARALWSARLDVAEGDEFTFAPLPGGALRVTRESADGAVHRALRARPDGAFEEASCWATDAPDAAPALMPGCAARLANALHLRDVEDAAREREASTPAGARVAVLSGGTLTRGAARSWCVRTPDGATGWAYLLPGELTGCPAAPRGP